MLVFYSGPQSLTDLNKWDRLRMNLPLFFLVMHLSRSGVACAVTALICVIVATCLGLFAAARQQIVFAMIAGVCFFASSKWSLYLIQGFFPVE